MELKYDALENDSDDDYFNFVGGLKLSAAENLKTAKGQLSMIEHAIETYLDKGYAAHLSSSELVDFFCVSTPSILSEAGYSEEEEKDVIKVYDQLNSKFYAKYYAK